MNKDLYPVPDGATGTVVGVRYFQDDWDLLMNWDPPNSNRLINVIVGVDDLELID